MSAPKRYTIAVDFDGALHPYTNGWTGLTPEDEPPVAGAAEALAELHLKYDVVVFSTRCEETAGQLAVQNWLITHGLWRYISGVTGTKPGALAYIDDRAVPFTGDWTAALAATKQLVKRGPWNKRGRPGANQEGPRT